MMGLPIYHANKNIFSANTVKKLTWIDLLHFIVQFFLCNHARPRIILLHITKIVQLLKVPISDVAREENEV